LDQAFGLEVDREELELDCHIVQGQGDDGFRAYIPFHTDKYLILATSEGCRALALK
jgi:hypothetical protein